MISTEQMIEKLNNHVNKSLNITCYGTYWLLHSYELGTLFSGRNTQVEAPTFREVIEKAYDLISTSDDWK